MPISYGMVEIQMKLLPLILNADGSSIVTVRIGSVKDGNFTATTEKQVSCSVEATALILDAMPVQGFSRRDDLSLAIYTYLVTNGHVEPGTIS